MIQVTYQLNNQSGDQVDFIIIPDIYPTKEPITAPVFGGSIRDSIGFPIAMPSGDPIGSLIYDPTKYSYEVPIINISSSPSETPTKYPSCVPK